MPQNICLPAYLLTLKKPENLIKFFECGFFASRQLELFGKEIK